MNLSLLALIFYASMLKILVRSNLIKETDKKQEVTSFVDDIQSSLFSSFIQILCLIFCILI